MHRHLALLALFATALGCPGEPEPSCLDDGCSDDAYCDEASGQCRTEFAIADASLEACLREALGQPDGALTIAGCRDLARLECPDRGIASVQGLQHLRGLSALSLWENQVQDLQPLRQSVALRSLQLGRNAIHDLEPLRGLTGLERLGLAFNQIDDIYALVDLGALRWLNLDHNAIPDFWPLERLDALTWVTAEHNPGDAAWGVAGELATQGAEVYKRRPPASEPVLDTDDRDAPSDALRWPWLGYQLRDDGSLQLVLRDGARAIPLRREDAGALALEGDRVLYALLGRRFEIGTRSGERLLLCQGAHAAACQLSIARKGPRGRADVFARELVYSASLLLRDDRGALGGPFHLKADGEAWDGLEPYALASPNQQDAGSCVFMANTGAMEILMNQRLPLGSFDYLGDTDLSERYLMNASDLVSSTVVPYHITDLVQIYNHFGGSLLSRDYPFALGYVRDEGDSTVLSTSSDPEAYPSCYVNWFDALPTGWRDQLTATPAADRTLVFVDPDLNRDSIWNVGLMDDDAIERIKHELRTKRAPVVVVYNHYLYWHASLVIGYDDNLQIGRCPMVEDTLDYFDQEGASDYARKIRAAMAREGGCRDRGVFIVRDSIYDGGSEEPMYSYGEGYSDRYSRRITLHEYEWAKYLGNHAYAVHR